MNKKRDMFIDIYENHFIKVFRKYNTSVFVLSIYGLGQFLVKNDEMFNMLLERLKANDFIISFKGSEETVDVLHIEYTDMANNKSGTFDFPIVNLPSTIELSSRADISILCIFIMKIVAQLICRYKILYKAIVLDLDDTLWPGTLSEDGTQKIIENLHAETSVPFIAFMKFVRTLSKELGLYVAICSRNDADSVKELMSKLDEDIFPIKDCINCIIANNNDKSDNIRLISSKLSILPNSIVFIDDNKIVRDEVINRLPDVCVFDWNNHYELITKIIIGCVFERKALSFNSQNRIRQFEIIQSERVNNKLPELLIDIHDDEKHIESTKLYNKSNQFKFVSTMVDYTDAKSLFFEIFRVNGDSIGICSALTFVETEEYVKIINWAISCRYFEIGLEEYILLYIKAKAGSKRILFSYQYSEYNMKTQELLDKYSDLFLTIEGEPLIELVETDDGNARLINNTNLKSIR